MSNNNVLDKIRKSEYSILSEAVLKLEKSLEVEGNNLNAIDMTSEELEQLKKFKDNISKIREIVDLCESNRVKEWDLDSNFTNIKMSKLKIGDELIECSSYGKALAALAAWLLKDNYDKFKKIAEDMDSIFNEDTNLFRACAKIQGTNMYVNTNMNANTLVKIMKEVINRYGLTKEVKIIVA